MLFYYFKNKKGLYFYLIDYAINVIVNEFLRFIDTKEPDFIERFRSTAHLKMKYHDKNPNVSNFIATVYLNEEIELPSDLKTRLEELEKSSYAKLYHNIDKTLFRNDVNVDKAFKLIRWAIEGYQNELISQFKGQYVALTNLDPYWEEFYEYLAILKTSFYKKKRDEK